MRVNLSSCLNETDNINRLILELFVWKRSSEGHKYWSHVRKGEVPFPFGRVLGIMDDGYVQIMFSTHGN